MAGDWIKMRSNLRRHPKVVRIASALNADRLRVVGGLHAVWCLFDEHSEDGQLSGYTPSAVDEEIGWPGFTQALIGVGWVDWDGNDGLSLPEFDTHNGASAKRRAQEADRKRAERGAAKEQAQGVEKSSASDADKKRTREEKRREESSSLRSEERQRASRLPADWTLPDEWAVFCRTERPDLDPSKTAERFADYWRAKPGAQGRKLDWLATWRNWVRNERAPPPGQRLSRAAENAAVIAELTGGLMAPKPKEQSRATGEIIDV